MPKSLARAVMIRDRGVCQIAGPDCTVRATCVDHIVPWAEGGQDTLENLRAACDACHDPKSAEEARRGKQRWSRRRPPAPRPGSEGAVAPARRGSRAPGAGGVSSGVGGCGPLGDPLPLARGARTA